MENNLVTAKITLTLDKKWASNLTPEELTDYIKTYKKLNDVLDQLTTEGGLNERFEAARRKLTQLNLSEDRITYVLQLPEKLVLGRKLGFPLVVPDGGG